MTEPGSSKLLALRLLTAFVSGVLASGVAAAALCFTGHLHFGAIERETPPPPAPRSAEPPPKIVSTYDAVIRPLLDAKCAHCHGEKKQKAGLSLASEETISKGGKHGPALDPAAPEKSLMLARIMLALDEDKHMPPDDEEQLAPEELAALQSWIRAGAPFSGVVEGVSAAVTVQSVPVAKLPPESPTLAAADPAALAALEAALVHVQPVSQGSPLLWVDFAAAAKTADDPRARALLEPLRAQLAELSLARSKVGDETLSLLAQCKSLRRLDVRATAIGDAGVTALAALPELAELVLSQNQLTDASVESLLAMPKLQSVHLWRSGISAAAIAQLKEARPVLRVDDGDAAASAALEVESTVAFTKSAAAPTPAASSASAPALTAVNTKCPVTGAPVKAKYTIVHEGKVIGFCCPECPKEFWADPAKFADRLQ